MAEPTRPQPHAETSPSNESWQHDRTWKILTTISLWIDRVRKHVWDSRLRLVTRPLSKIAQRIDIQLTYIEMQHGRWRSEFDEYAVGADQDMSLPALWVIELFPPSEAHALHQAITKNRWDSETVQMGVTPSTTSVISESRATSAYQWWNVCELANTRTTRRFLGATSTDLPREFERIKITGLQVGKGITAMVACFTFADTQSRNLNDAWHRQYLPEIHRRPGQLAQAQAPAWVAYRRVQTVRERQHEIARRWLAAHAPGAFAAGGNPQPLIACLLFSGYGPTAPTNRVTDSHLRALGIRNDGFDYIAAEELPGLALEPVDNLMNRDLVSKATWSLWGKREHFYDQHPRIRSEGGRDESHIVHIIDSHARNSFVQIANGHFLELLQERFATVRDTARVQNNRASSRSLRGLRSNLVTLSLDTTSASSDVRHFNRSLRKVRYEHEPQFVRGPAPWVEEQDRTANVVPIPQRDFGTETAKTQKSMIRSLVVAEQDTRAILSSAASITAALQGLQASRVARWIAFVSLLVAALGFLLADPADHTRLSSLHSWWFDHWPSWTSSDQ
ncbi:hypothetical protein KZO37_16020 [Rhodococcus fascians]|uniref:hypothetical protein n=1 Tax=Rhodococcoides fascians TaxID=1828 RepID=UPI001C5FB0AB|nr:hypothetical protein [Rhodococcus fascians]MBW4780874.1 hypothetical protein [Rhodococcus fascians]